MGLRIIYGKPGSGKTEYCYSEIAKKIKEKNKIYMITPEQFSFTAEEKLMKTVSSHAILNAEVVHLSRMAYRVINEIGGSTKTNLSESGKAMLIYNILNKYKKDLKFLGKSDENIDLCMTAITEFKQHKISVQDLQKEIEKTEDIYLKTKLQDITLVYKKFEEQIKNQYIDENDLLTILAQNIGKTDLIKNSIIYLDEFSGFTHQEYEVIKELVKYAKQVNITICTDNLNINTNPDIDIFYSNKITIAKLWKMINENDLKLEEPVYLKEQYRFQTPELQYLSENINKNKITKYEKNVENIQLFLAQNPYSEIENIGKQITKLIYNKNIRYKDIAIISKNIEEYSSLVRAIFSKYDIPVFIDEKRDVNQNIIVQYILAILEVLNKNFSKDSIFNYLKLGLTNIEQDEIFELENYCTKWGIQYKKWEKDFEYDIEQNDRVKRLNELRKEIIKPFIELKEKINKEKTFESITKALYSIIQSEKIEEKIQEKIQELEERNLLDLAKEYKESYQIILELFDEIILVFGKQKSNIDEYLKILKVGLKNSGLGKIPGTQDQITFGDIDRSRSHKVKVVFIIGLNDGNFPKINKDEGFLDDKDRNLLKQDGLELAKGTQERLYEDNFNIYKAFNTAENKLYLSYLVSNKEGNALRASTIVNKIKRMYPKLKEQSDKEEKEYEISNEKITYEELLDHITKLKKNEKISKIWYEIYKYYKTNIKWQEKLKNDLEGLEYTNLPQKISVENTEKLYGNILHTSVSKLETYQKCAFSYYLQYGLKLKEKEELKIHNFETGSFMHETIDEFFKIIQEKGNNLTQIQEEGIYEIVSKIIEEKLKSNRNFTFQATVKYKILVQRLKKMVTKALKYIIQTLIYSDFSISGTEVKFKPVIFNLQDGKKVEITGKIDRIDTAKRRRWKIHKDY